MHSLIFIGTSTEIHLKQKCVDSIIFRAQTTGIETAGEEAAMTEITSYLDGPFPMDVSLQGVPWRARLFGVMGNRVVGMIYIPGDVPTIGGGREWDADGVHSSSHPGLNLVPPPAQREREVRVLADEISEIENRIAENPNAPDAWIEGDRRTIAVLVSRIHAIDPEYEP